MTGAGQRIISRISYREAIEFKEKFDEPAWVSVSFNASGMATLKAGSEETDPNIELVGIDENYLSVSGYEINTGRNFSRDEIQLNRRLVLLGSDIAGDIFPTGIDPVGKEISVAGLKFEVAGVMKSKGASHDERRPGLFYTGHHCPSVFFPSQHEFQYHSHAFEFNKS